VVGTGRGLGAAHVSTVCSTVWTGRSIVVRSVTGYSRRFPRSDGAVLLSATHIADEPLSPGHGAPARLVVPGRRGYWWVEWVTAIDVDDTPWWWQPPFPVT
jgi:molybdopterin-dependent oxidoreductase-like protein protein